MVPFENVDETIEEYDELLYDCFALSWWSSLKQSDATVFNPLKPLISKESADFSFSGKVFAEGGVQGVFTAF